MSKAINWPEQFADEIIKEDSDSLRTALRLGTIYYDNGYYTPDEIIDIRVNHRVVRRGQIMGDMQISAIKDLNNETISRYKSPLQEKTNIINFLASNYNQQINDETIVTIVTYKNLPLETLDSLDDPHLD